MKKTIAVEYEHNTVVVCYEVENGVEEAKLNIIPLFNYREAGEVSEKADLKFDVSVNENILTLEEYYLLKYKNNKKVLVKQK